MPLQVSSKVSTPGEGFLVLCNLIHLWSGVDGSVLKVKAGFVRTNREDPGRPIVLEFELAVTLLGIDALPPGERVQLLVNESLINS